VTPSRHGPVWSGMHLLRACLEGQRSCWWEHSVASGGNTRRIDSGGLEGLGGLNLPGTSALMVGDLNRGVNVRLQILYLELIKSFVAGSFELSQPPPKASTRRTLALMRRVRIFRACAWSCKRIACSVMTER
jgi:hypothetical protein